MTRTLAPFVEFDLKDAKVRLVFPEQTVRLQQSGPGQPKKVGYDVHVNGKVLKVDARLLRCPGDCLKVEEQRVELTSPLKELEVRLPALLGGQDYKYEHTDECAYAFVPTGPDRARLHYSYRDGRPNPLPRRYVWLLVRDPLAPELQADCEDERAVWETYRAFRIDLADVDSLTLRGNSDTVQLPCAPTFTLHGSATVSDDFAKVEPLFSAGPITVVAPQPNPAGWRVWICSRTSGHRLLSQAWTGEQPLQIETPGDLPCEGGEFQLDVCQGNEAVPAATFFFRMAPVLEMQYPKNLMFPAPKGHEPASVTVVLRRDAEGWELRWSKRTEITRTGECFCVKLSSTNDTARFELVKEGRPVMGVPIQVTVPRLRWALSPSIIWTDTPLMLERDSMRYGIQLDLCARTNMDATRHALSAVLQRGPESLQEARFALRQGIYRLPLNGFYDTISGEACELVIRLVVHSATDGAKLGETVALRIPGVTTEEPQESRVQCNKTAGTPICPAARSKQCAGVAASPKASVGRGGRRRRDARGFSRKELRRAGIRFRDATRARIRVDRRRKSCHEINVEVLRPLQEKVKHHAD